MGKKLFVLSILFCLLATGCGKSNTQAQTQDQTQISTCPKALAEATVNLKDVSFDPPSLDIKQCTKVTFKNVDVKEHWPASDFHPTHGIYPEFDPLKGVEAQGEWSFIFDRLGSWKYHDHLNPQVHGVVNVEKNN